MDKLSQFNHFIRSIEITTPGISSSEEYPFCLDAIKYLSQMEALHFHPKVTFLVGENGTGKSTILEAIAVAFGFNAEGGSKNFTFSSKDTHSILHKHLKVIKGYRACKNGFFLRAESFYNLATNLDQMGPEALAAYGGKSLHEQSHGESFFSLFMNRLGGNGVYILDEPEAALSPARQLAFLSRLHDLVKEDAQFIIATHSPILMAYPDAWIYQISNTLERIAYDETENFQITQSFLNNPSKMLNILLED